MIAILPCYSFADSALQDACSEAEVILEAVFIEGHTDITGTVDHNWDLSTRRAVTTYRELVERSPALGKLQTSDGDALIGVSGYGPTRAVNPDDLAANRRIDIRFLLRAPTAEELQGDLDVITGGEDGQAP